MVVNAQPYFGLLAIGLIYFCLRYALAGWARFSETIGLAAFWLYNGGLVSGYCRRRSAVVEGRRRGMWRSPDSNPSCSPHIQR